MRATIKNKREVAKGTLLVIFDLLGEEFDYRPGQYFWVELLDPPYEDEEEVGISVIDPPDEPESEKVTVPPEEPAAEAGDDESHDDE